MGVSRRGFLGRFAAGAAAGAATGVGVAVPAGAQPGPDGRTTGPAALTGMRTDRAWQEFLAAQDPLWKRMPRAWYEGPLR